MLGYGAGAQRLCGSRCALRRFVSTLRHVPASDTAVREVPTPLLFVAAPRWTGGATAQERFAPLWTHVREQGFSSLFLDLDPDTKGCAPSDTLALMEEEMVRLLRHPPPEVGVPPFPPALTACGVACVIAEKYASSHPLSALQLIDPPLSMARAAMEFPHLLGAKALPEFRYEPFFPARVVWTAEALAERQAREVPWFEMHRIEAQREEDEGGDVDRYEWASLEHGADEMLRWLEDEVGLYVYDTHPS